MNRLANQFISSMQGFLGFASDDEARTAIGIEDIRQAMLDALGEDGCYHYPQIERRVLFAPDIQGLWYLRSDLMIAISNLQGESSARQKVRQITNMFDGLLPKGMISRPAPLSR